MALEHLLSVAADEHYILIFQHIAKNTIPISRASGNSWTRERTACELRSTLLNEIVLNENSGVNFNNGHLILIAETLVQEEMTHQDAHKNNLSR